MIHLQTGKLIDDKNLPNTASSGYDHVLSGKMIARDLYWVHRTSQRTCRASRLPSGVCLAKHKKKF
jgi:hypothetical protein